MQKPVEVHDALRLRAGFQKTSVQSLHPDQQTAATNTTSNVALLTTLPSSMPPLFTVVRDPAIEPSNCSVPPSTWVYIHVWDHNHHQQQRWLVLGSQGRPREEPNLSFRRSSNLRPAWRCDRGGARTAMDPHQCAGTSPRHSPRTSNADQSAARPAAFP
jgi:hypothetical protein